MRALRTSRELGATAVEYALMVALIAAVVVVAAYALGKASSTSLSDTCSKINSTNTTSGTC